MQSQIEPVTSFENEEYIRLRRTTNDEQQYEEEDRIQGRRSTLLSDNEESVPQELKN